MSKFIGRFVEEAREHVAALNQGMRALESSPGDREVIHQIFRSAHTIKGSSRMLKLLAISELAHKVEDVFGALRDGKVGFSPELSAVLYKGIDAVAGLIEKTARGEELPVDQGELLTLLEAATEGKFAEKASGGMNDTLPPVGLATGVEAPPPETAEPGKLARDATTAFAVAPDQPPKVLENLKARETIRVHVDKLSELIRLTSEITSRQSRAKESWQEVSLAAKQLKNLADKLTAAGPAGREAGGDDCIMLLNRLAKELKHRGTAGKADYEFQNLLTRELQERALQLRMLPLATIFDTFHRAVREIIDSCGKEVTLSIVGGEIEMDKKIIEKLGDPLVHMLRNAIDHGLEGPEERQQAGKPARGNLSLTACYEGDKVLIVLEDDGRGLPLEKIREKALKNGLVGPEALAGMSLSEIQNLIFLPGFSTSSIITDLSGRGVGMDVVRKNIVDDLKGAVSIDSRPGEGTTFQLRLPMTLAIMHVVMVEVAGVLFALPDNYINEIIKVGAAGVIEVFDKLAVNIREQLVPVEQLQAILGLPGKNADRGEELLLLVVKVGAERLGLVVDSVVDEEDMVIKSLPRHMHGNKMVSGVIITSRDQVVNVLNVPAIFLAAKEAKSGLRREFGDTEREIRVLVVDDSVNTREIEKSILEAYGYQVTLAGDGVEALEKARKSKYDIVITDVEMPRMDGFTLTESLRAEAEYRDTPIMLLTSRDKEEDKRRGIQVGANAYILKGDFEQSNLIATIENLL
jgi:chemotaxis protein histidine kinase CheA